VEYFENLLTSIISRIVEEDSESGHPDGKKKSKGQLSLQKARSIINEDVSETLLVQGFDIIFKELNRYIHIMCELYQGVDWTSYVRFRTNMLDKDDRERNLEERTGRRPVCLLDEPEEARPVEQDQKQQDESALSDEKKKELLEQKQK
jgi:hypothetical protein